MNTCCFCVLGTRVTRLPCFYYLQQHLALALMITNSLGQCKPDLLQFF